MKVKVLISSDTKENLEKALNDHFYSITYKIMDNNEVTWKNGELRKDLIYRVKNLRHQIVI